MIQCRDGSGRDRHGRERLIPKPWRIVRGTSPGATDEVVPALDQESTAATTAAWPVAEAGDETRSIERRREARCREWLISIAVDFSRDITATDAVKFTHEVHRVAPFPRWASAARPG